jgi:hypothetical protein
MAVAGALGLRCYCLVEPRKDKKVSLALPDVGVDQEWDLDELHSLSSRSEPTESPDAHLMAKLLPFATSEDSITNSAVLSFLYLYACLAKHSRWAMTL